MTGERCKDTWHETREEAIHCPHWFDEDGECCWCGTPGDDDNYTCIYHQPEQATP